MLTLPDVLQAQQFISPYIKHTDLIHSPYLSEKSGAEVWLKLENQQPTGSFKVRGALNKIGRLTGRQKAQGIVAASAGNHALGVAHAIQSLGNVKADIFVPTTTPQAKVEKLQRYPLHLHQAGETYDAAHEAAKAFRATSGGVEVSAYDDMEVITGHATTGLEILADLPQTDIIIIPVGGGGIIAGVTAVAHIISPECRLVGVQPEASPAALLSLRHQRAHDPYDHEPTIADGLAGGFGVVPFEVVRPFPPHILLASEQEIRHAIFTLAHQHQLIIEPSGAIAIVPLLHKKLDVSGKTIVCVLTGGNIDTRLLTAILNESLK
jgi:threonine dehydratase